MIGAAKMRGFDPAGGKDGTERDFGLICDLLQVCRGVGVKVRVARDEAQHN